MMSARSGYVKDVRIITTGIKQNESIMCELALGRKWPGAFVLRIRGGSYAQHAGMGLRTDDGS